METIIVAVDGASSGDAALGWVIDRARTGEVAIEVTGVFEPLPSELVLAGSEVRKSYDRVLAGAVARVESALPGVDVSAVLRTGHTRPQLVSASSTADLLVVGTQRTADYPREVYASMPIRLAGATRCVTVVVPAGWTPKGAGVTVGLEGTAQQPRVVDFAREEAQRRGVPLTVVHCWSVPTLLAVAAFAHAGVWKSIGAAHERALDATLARLRKENPDLVVHRRLKEGNAARMLAEDAVDSDLLVVGRHGSHPVEEMLLGSTSHDLLLGMPCAIAIVPE